MTIDHAAEARRVLGNFPHDDIRNNREALAWAQVHATLALTEQQRIANLIALSVPQTPLGAEDGTRVSIPSFGSDFKLRDDIKKGLGL